MRVFTAHANLLRWMVSNRVDIAMHDFAGTPRSADDVHLMALANLHGEYAEVRTTDAILAGMAGD